MAIELYFNQGRCARLNLPYNIYQEAQPPTEANIEVSIDEFVSVMYELDDDQYNRALYNIVVPALEYRIFYLLVNPIPSKPGYFDISIPNNNTQ